MERTTIDFGIDLGTTNSAIAVLDGVNTQIVKNNDDKDITPSAVYIKKSGEIYTGDRAKNALERDNLCDNAFVEFKRRMGSDFEYVFPASGQRKRPEDLSAEILKSLRGDVSQRLGEDAKAAVITIPAMFEQAQCAATKKAGQLAGFEQTALLQEPVAASLAYGFQKEIVSVITSVIVYFAAFSPFLGSYIQTKLAQRSVRKANAAVKGEEVTK